MKNKNIKKSTKINSKYFILILIFIVAGLGSYFFHYSIKNGQAQNSSKTSTQKNNRLPEKKISENRSRVSGQKSTTSSPTLLNQRVVASNQSPRNNDSSTPKDFNDYSSEENLFSKNKLDFDVEKLHLFFGERFCCNKSSSEVTLDKNVPLIGIIQPECFKNETLQNEQLLELFSEYQIIEQELSVQKLVEFRLNPISLQKFSQIAHDNPCFFGVSLNPPVVPTY